MRWCSTPASPRRSTAGTLPGRSSWARVGVPTWAGTVLPDGGEILLVVDRSSDLETVTWELLRIGYPAPIGWLADGISAWRTAARAVDTTLQITVHELKNRRDRGEVQVLDVRQPGEWARGQVEGATFITGAELPDRLGEVPDTTPVAVVCGSGFRSSVAASLLRRYGRSEVINVAGGGDRLEPGRLPDPQ